MSRTTQPKRRHEAILEGSGFAVRQASTTDAALDLFRQDDAVCVVLADHMLRGKTAELAGQIKKIKRTVSSGHAFGYSARQFA